MEKIIVNNIKSLGLDMINNAKSGHPGIVLGAAEIVYTLFAKHIMVNPYDPNWINRDRFVLSAGHGSALLYANLFMAGYNFKMEDIMSFRQVDSHTPGHPELDILRGVEATTGPLGQGIANGVGMALAAKKMHQKDPSIDYRVYVLVSDGDLMEGISYEAASLAGSLNLDNLIILYDANNISLDGKIDKVFDENVLARFSALGFATDYVNNGIDIVKIDEAITKAKSNKKPTIIKFDTIIGRMSKKQNTNIVHGQPLIEEDLNNVKRVLGFETSFEFSKEAQENYKNMILKRSMDKYNLTSKKKLEKLTINIKDFNFDEKNEELRVSNGKIISYLGAQNDMFISGSADLFSSNKTKIEDSMAINDTLIGQNLYFGVREHAMAAIANGLAMSGYRVVVSTFLTFMDYLKPALRLSALMELDVIYVFTHDSISVGQDGPTHQPIEQLGHLRMIPKINVYRPFDQAELKLVWEEVLLNNKTNVIVVSKEKVENFEHEVSLVDGAYTISKSKNNKQAIILATGYEVKVALDVQKDLYEKYKIDVEVLSVLDYAKFLKEYKNILEPGKKVIAIEAGHSLSWYPFVYDKKYIISIDSFGSSGSKEELFEKYGFGKDKITSYIKKLID
jgi:transketolase